ncbi:MAG: universal stress protein [Nitrospirota bacterium]|nr:universal stress protein [Nitrospirota bacterium]
MRILLAIDGSPQSTHTVQALAHFTPCEEVRLVHALALPDLDLPMITPEMRENLLKEIEGPLRKEGEELLDRTAAALPVDSGPISRVHEIGFPSHVILETAQSAHSDLIILGARGCGPIKELVLGSVSHRVLLHAPCSTLVVKSPFPTLRHILVTVEGQEDAAIILRALLSMPFREPVKMTVLTVWPHPRVPWLITLGQSQLLEEKALKNAQEMVDQIAGQFGAKYQSTGTVGMGDPAYVILEQERILNPDLIVVGSHGRKGISRFLLGSVSHTLVHQARCPVLVVR